MAKSIPKDGSEWIGHLYAEALAWDLKHWDSPTADTLQDSTILLRSLDLKIIRDPAFFKAMESVMINYATIFFNPLIIDTSEMSADQVVNTIAECVI